MYSKISTLSNVCIRMRVHKYWLKGDSKGKSEIFLDNLPGFPDNIHATGHGSFLIGIVGVSGSVVV